MPKHSHPLILFLALATTVPAQDFTCTTNSGAITITSYTGPGGAVIIPSTINDLPVTEIGRYAFSSKSAVTSVTIPDSVTNLGAYAFRYCDNLTTVILGSGITVIGQSAFESCSKLNSITIPDSVTTIENETFYGCTSLTNVTLGNGVTVIGHWAFPYSSLAAITVAPSNPFYASVDGVLFDKAQTTLIQYPAAKTGGSYSIPEGVAAIGAEAFLVCASLTNVTIADSVTNLGPYAFAYSDALTTVTMGSGITAISDHAFYGCDNLEWLTIGNGVTQIGDYAFYECDSLVIVSIPEGVVSIGAWGFGSCSTLREVNLPTTLTTLGEYAFYDCSGLDWLSLGSGVTNIGAWAFFHCESLHAITVDSANPSYASVDGVLFNKAETTLIQYPARRGSATVPYTIPNTVTSIGDGAFAVGRRLREVIIPESVTFIGARAFMGSHSEPLAAITVAPSNPSYASVDGVLFDKAQTTLIQYPQAKTGGSYSIPDGVATIGAEAFLGCTILTNVTIGNSVTDIGDYAFWACTKLTAINFAGIPPRLGVSVFSQPATIRYLPGAIGWNTIFGGRPTAPWHLPSPVILAPNLYSDVQTDQFGFRISWATNASVVVETSSSLSTPVWSPFATNTISMGVHSYTDGWSWFYDSELPEKPACFYRVRSH